MTPRENNSTIARVDVDGSAYGSALDLPKG